MPHRAVIRMEKQTSRVRITCVCVCVWLQLIKTQSNKKKSLNECLVKFLSLIPGILDVLIRFRIPFNVWICVDIEKAFLIISITEEDGISCGLMKNQKKNIKLSRYFFSNSAMLKKYVRFGLVCHSEQFLLTRFN